MEAALSLAKDLASGFKSSLIEGALALLGSSLMDVVYWPIDKADAEDLNVLGIRVCAHLLGNGVVLALMHKGGLLAFDSNTGLILFSVLFIAGQEKFLVRFKNLGLHLESFARPTWEGIRSITGSTKAA